MIEISSSEIKARLKFDNPWWSSGEKSGLQVETLPRRSYFEAFEKLALDRSVNRAVVLLGPRRVGKTVMAQQLIQAQLEGGIPAQRLLYLSLETPVYTGLSLEKLLGYFTEEFAHSRDTPLLVVFDEIQYLRDWEIHLKSLVDSFPRYRFIATGSAAAALRLKSRESGAGRFTEFLLPPLTFSEYLRFIGEEDVMEEQGVDEFFHAKDIEKLNQHFVDYLNFGGYPEAVFSQTVRTDSARFIKSDIIDKVLLRDLPGLYGIQDIQELNRLFTTLAYNTGNEVSLEALAQSSGVAKNTLKRYIEYLEAAFLVRRVFRIDQSARRFQRATAFKIYLTNPTMRAALFGPISESDPAMGNLAETAVFSQWFHHQEFVENLHYARWPEGELDIVGCDRHRQKPLWAVEIKWSDRPIEDHSLLRHMIAFTKRHKGMEEPLVTTKTKRGSAIVDDAPFHFAPCAEYAYTVSKNILARATAASPKTSEFQTSLPLVEKPPAKPGKKS
ncbi:MAG: ATP-binding protein [Candidatus Didemnitutus sp.]|nr:ATP-binding protein [Candidatus Didemnitutus sp.]